MRINRDVATHVWFWFLGGAFVASIAFWLAADIIEKAGAIESESEEESGPTLMGNDLTFTTENELLLTIGPADIFIGVDPDTLEPLMSYDADKKRWTFSDRFLADVADALVPVLKEHGFVPVSDPPLFYRLFSETVDKEE